MADSMAGARKTQDKPGTPWRTRKSGRVQKSEGSGHVKRTQALASKSPQWPKVD